MVYVDDFLLSVNDSKYEAVEKMLTENIYLSNMINIRGESSLLIAAQNDDIEMVRLLLKYNAYPLITDCNDTDSIYHAIEQCNLEMLKLLSENISLNYSDEDGNTPLHRAVVLDCIEIVQYLIDMGLDVNSTDSKNRTPLNLAIKYKRMDMVKLLIDRGANVNCQSTMSQAVDIRNTEIIDYILDHGYIKHNLNYMFLEVIRDGNIDIVKCFIHHMKGLIKSHHLSYAVKMDNIQVVRLILDAYTTQDRDNESIDESSVTIYVNNSDIQKLLKEYNVKHIYTLDCTYIIISGCFLIITGISIFIKLLMKNEW